jgi:catecholate siderophore receptor
VIRPPLVLNRRARRARARSFAAHLRRLGRGSALALLLAGAAAHAQEPARTQLPPAPDQDPAQREPRAQGEDEIEVLGREERPSAPVRPSLPRFTGSLLQLPQQIQVVPQSLLREQGVTTLRDALRNVGGISVSAGEGNAQGDNFTLRGYSAQNDTFIDGVRDRASYFRDTFNLESVEVVKGPSSSYFGRGSTGGVINQVTKSPLVDPAMSGSLAAGSGAYVRGTGDVNVPLGDSVAFRLNLMGHRSDVVGRDGADFERYGVAPSLAFGLGTPTQFTLSYLFQHEDNTPDYGLPYRGARAATLALPGREGKPIPVDRDTFYGLEHDDFERTKVDFATARLDHQLGDQTRLRNTTSYGHVERQAAPTAARICESLNGRDGCPTATDVWRQGDLFLLRPDASFAIRRGRPERDATDSILSNQTDVVTELQTGFARHTLAAGFDVSRETFSIKRFDARGPSSLGYDPETTGPSYSRSESARTYTTSLGAGAFLSDRVALGESFDLVGGVRWDLFKTRHTNDFPVRDEQDVVTASTGPDFKSTDRMLSYRAGLVYHPSEAQNYYVSYATSFNPSAEALSLSEGNASTPPEENRSIEIGAKWLLFGDQLNVQAALFQIDKTNARETDPITSISVLAGSQQVRGFELSAAGRLSTDWSVFAAYTFLESELTKSISVHCEPWRAGIFDTQGVPANCAEGNELARTPRHSASLWATYAPQGGRWTLAFGPTYSAERFSSTNVNRNRVPGYIRWDSMLGFRMSETVSLRLNLQNLTDEDYYVEVGGGHAVPAPGRSFILSSDFTY